MITLRITQPKQAVVSAFFEKARNVPKVDDHIRRVMRDVLDDEIREHMDSEGRGQWDPLAEETLEHRGRRWGYYSRRAWRTGRIGVWTGQNRRAALGEAGTRPLVGGIERRMRRKALVYFHRGRPGQTERPILSLVELKRKMKAALQEEIGKRLKVKVTPFRG